jgi:GNAT superfamily N-acetyltransferase
VADVPPDLERAEAGALLDTVAAVGGRHGFEATSLGDAVCVVAREVPAPELNRALGVGEDTDLGALQAFYAGTPHLVSCSDGAVAALRARGYEPGYAWMKFVRAAEPDASARTDLRLEVVGADRAGDFAAAVVGGFGMPARMAGVAASVVGRPGWTCLVAYDAARPVGAGALFVTGDQGWLGLGATLPDARGRGAQSAILAARVRLAAGQGAATVTTETGVREPGRPEPSYRNILRAGFEEAYERPNWRSPRTAGGPPKRAPGR